MFREAGNEYPIVVRLRQEDRDEIASVGDVLLSTPKGMVLPAKNVMVTAREQGPVQIERKNQERIQRVNAEVETTLSEGVEAVQARLPEIQVPQGFSVGFGNEVEEQAKSFRELQLVLILAILLVYTVMASQYESLRDPFIIMFSIPLAAIGVVGALLLTNTPFSMQAYIGVIMLAGIVVSNAILLVDYANTLRHRDKMELRPGDRAGRTSPSAPDSDDVGLHDARPGADVARDRRGLGAAGAAGARRHRRPADLDADHAGVRAGDVYAVRRRLARDVQARSGAGRQRRTERTIAKSDGRTSVPQPGLALGSQLVQQLLHRPARLRIDPVAGDLRQRLEHEEPLAKSRMRHPQSRLVDTSSPYRIRSRSSVRGAPAYGRSRPRSRSMHEQRRRAARAPSVVRRRSTAPLRNRACGRRRPARSRRNDETREIGQERTEAARPRRSDGRGDRRGCCRARWRRGREGVQSPSAAYSIQRRSRTLPRRSLIGSAVPMMSVRPSRRLLEQALVLEHLAEHDFAACPCGGRW